MKPNSKIKFDPFIKGEKIDLVVLTEEIVEKTNWFNWFNDEETTLHMQKHYFPNSKKLQIEFFNNALKNNQSTIQLGILDKKKSVLFGVISLSSIDLLNRNAEWSVLIGEKEYRQLFYVNEAIDLMLKHAFFTLNLHKVNGGYVETLKEWGIFMQRRFNFKEEGRLKSQMYKNGEYLDIILIGLLKNDYLKINNKIKKDRA